MTKKDNGGPAFPVIPPCSADGNTPAGYPFPDAGATLRDLFALGALAGMLARTGNTVNGEPMSVPRHAQKIAEVAFEVADAMLAERAR